VRVALGGLWDAAGQDCSSFLALIQANIHISQVSWLSRVIHGFAGKQGPRGFAASGCQWRLSDDSYEFGRDQVLREYWGNSVMAGLLPDNVK
jgi:hypothetical protein